MKGSQTAAALFGHYDKEDVEGLIKDRYDEAKSEMTGSLQKRIPVSFRDVATVGALHIIPCLSSQCENARACYCF